MDKLKNLQDKIDYVLDNNDAVFALAAVLSDEKFDLDTKSEIIQLLSALCAYRDGLRLVFRCIEIWKERTCARYRFGPMVDDLNECKSLSYVITLTILVNCMLAACDGVEERNRLRNELFGLRLQDVFNKLRMVPSLCDHLEFQKQLDVFDERKMADDVRMITVDGVDLNSHSDIFDAILKQVSQKKPHEVLFLNILQHLLQIDSRDSLADFAWEAAEKLVCRAKLISSKEEAEKLLRLHTLSVDIHRCQCQSAGSSGSSLLTADEAPSTDGQRIKLAPLQTLVPVAPTLVNGNDSVGTGQSLSGNGPPPMPPPLPPALFPFAKTSAPPPPPLSAPRPAESSETVADSRLTLSFNLPVPKQKLKTFAWNKLPTNKVSSNGDNLWSKAARNFNGYSLDLDSLENLFCQNPTTPSTTNGFLSTERQQSATSASTSDLRKKRENNEVNLLDSKRSLNVNIFLRQFKGDVQDLIVLINDGEANKVGLEKLRSLMKLMPETDEIEALTHFADDRNKLGTAEKFFLALIGVSNYQLRVECMLLKEEFATVIDFVKPSVQIIIAAANDLKNNKSLQEIMYLVLMVGNYLNAGSYGGNAAGFKMTSLWKLMEIRANKPNMTLLHYVVMETDKNNPALLDFTNHMKHLEEASKISIDTIVSDFRSLKEKLERVSRQLSAKNCSDVFNQMVSFLEYAKRETFVLERKVDEMEKLRQTLATFFCEDPIGFKLEDCFKIFHHFCTRFNKAMDENNERKVQEEKVEMRRKLKEQQQQKNLLMKESASFEDGNFHRSASERRLSSTSKSTELLDLLKGSQESLDVDENLINSSKVRRSLRKRIAGVNDLVSSTERERPMKAWRQRVEELMAEEETSSEPKPSKTRFSLEYSNPPNNSIERFTSVSTECSPIYSKPFEPTRLSSTLDISRRQTAVVSDPPVLREPSKATWRLDRDKRAHSLYAANNNGNNAGSCSEDLNDLLETLEMEKKQHEIGRRFGRSFRGNADLHDPPMKKWSLGISEETPTPVADHSSLNKHYSLPPTPNIPTIQLIADKNSNAAVKEDSLSQESFNDRPRYIDEVVRHVEKTKAEIEQCALDLDQTMTGCQSDQQSDSGLEQQSSPELGVASSSLEIIKVSTDVDEIAVHPHESEHSTTECIVDFSLPSNLSAGSYCVDDVGKVELDEVGEKSAVNVQWRDSRSPEDHSDCISTVSPTESLCDRDEGFETESHATCIEHVSSLASDLPAVINKSKSAFKPPTRPNFMSLTKASTVRTVNSIDKPGSKIGSRQPAAVSTRRLTVDANKNTQTRLTSAEVNKKPVQPTVAKNGPQFSRLQPLRKTIVPAASVGRSPLARSNTNVSTHSSASSHGESPVRKTRVSTISKPAVSPVTKLSNLEKASVAKIPTKTVVSKQKLEVRSRVEAKKDVESSSDSEKLPVTESKKRIPLKMVKTQKQPVDPKKPAIAANEKTFQRLMSPPNMARSHLTAGGNVLQKSGTVLQKTVPSRMPTVRDSQVSPSNLPHNNIAYPSSLGKRVAPILAPPISTATKSTKSSR